MRIRVLCFLITASLCTGTLPVPAHGSIRPVARTVAVMQDALRQQLSRDLADLEANLSYLKRSVGRKKADYGFDALLENLAQARASLDEKADRRPFLEPGPFLPVVLNIYYSNAYLSLWKTPKTEEAKTLDQIRKQVKRLGDYFGWSLDSSVGGRRLPENTPHVVLYWLATLTQWLIDGNEFATDDLTPQRKADLVRLRIEMLDAASDVPVSLTELQHLLDRLNASLVLSDGTTIWVSDSRSAKGLVSDILSLASFGRDYLASLGF